MKTINVVCGIIVNNDNKIFLCRRNQEKSMGGFWEFPGGKIEQNEDEKSALKRELYEELKMSVEVGNHFKTVVHNYETFEIKLIAYMCTFLSSSYEMTDHDKYEWIEVENVLNYKLSPADIPIAEFLQKNYLECKN